MFSLLRYDHPHILSGQGTAGLEIAEQVDNIDAIVIPVGGGGLLAGCAVALKNLCPNIMIIVSHLCLVFIFTSNFNNLLYHYSNTRRNFNLVL